MRGFERRPFVWTVTVLAAAVLSADSVAQTTAGAFETTAAPIAWAKPLKGGPVRVAAVVPADAVSDLSALEAGFDLRLEMYPFGEAGDETPDHVLTAALRARCDVLVVSSIAMADSAPETREALAARIGTGMGVLWVSFATNGQPELRDFLAPLGLVPLEQTPDFAGRSGGAALADLRPGFDEASAYAGTQGRAVEFRFWRQRPLGQALIPPTPSDALNAPMNIENYRAIAGRALLWTARRDPEATLLRIEDRAPEGPDPISTPPQLPQEFIERMKQAALPGVLRPYAIVLDRPAPRRYSLRVQMRYPDRDIRWSYLLDETVGKGMTEVALTVPVGTGHCFLDVWIMDGPKIVDWLTQPLEVPALPSFGTVTFGQAAIEPNDRLTISAQVHGRIAPVSSLSSVRPKDVLFLRGTDLLGRVVAMRDVVIPSEKTEFVQELALVDVLGPYVRAEAYAATAGDSPLSQWIREHAAFRSANLAVRQPLPPGLALIVNETGEGSFAASARRRALAAQGVDFINGGAEAELGNIARDGLRAIGCIDGLPSSPGGSFDARSPEGAALRQAAARYASLRPGLYTVARGADKSPPEALEKIRLGIEKTLREADPHALAALLDGDFSAAGTGGFRVLPAVATALDDRASAQGQYLALRSAMPEGDHAIERCHWLPWLCALRGANALWISARGTNAEAERLDAILSEASRVREGVDVLLARAKVAPLTNDPHVDAQKNVVSQSARFEFGKAIVYAYLADPDAAQKVSVRLKTEKDAQIYDSLAPLAHAAHSLPLKLRPGEAAVACVLPYEVTRIALEFPRAITPGRRLTVHATVKTRGALPGDHVLRLNCFDPAGRLLKHYSRTMFARDGAGTTWLPLAYNEAPGAYRIVVRDVLSGVETEESFTVEGPKNATASAH